MQFGVCAGTGEAEALKSAGVDFLELNVQGALKAEAGDDAFLKELTEIQASPLPCTAANCFIPGHLKITGPSVDMPALERYVNVALARAQRAGITTIVFGSGGARQIPEGFDRQTAWRQLLDFGKRLGAPAQQCGVTVVVEPLNRGECNVLTTVGEAAGYVREINHPNVRLLIDAYHWGRDADSYDDLVNSGPLLHHAHIATFAARRAPGLEACDFGPFFRALKEGGYDGPISVEAGWNKLTEEASGAMATLRRLAAAAGL